MYLSSLMFIIGSLTKYYYITNTTNKDIQFKPGFFHNFKFTKPTFIYFSDPSLTVSIIDEYTKITTKYDGGCEGVYIQNSGFSLTLASNFSIAASIHFMVNSTLTKCNNFSLSTIPYGFIQEPSNDEGTYCWLFPSSLGRISFSMQTSNIFYLGDSFAYKSFYGDKQLSDPFKGNWLFVSTKNYKNPSSSFKFNITGVSNFSSNTKSVDLSAVNDFIAFLSPVEPTTTATTRYRSTYDYSGYIIGAFVGIIFVTLGSLLIFIIGALIFKKYYKQCTGQTHNNRNINNDSDIPKVIPFDENSINQIDQYEENRNDIPLIYGRI